MPPLEQHYRWLSQNGRYRGQLADALYARARKIGDRYLQYQAHYHPLISASRWNDLEGYYGMARAEQRVLYRRNCGSRRDYPVLFLVGLKPVSIGDGSVYVRKARGLYRIVSLRALVRNDQPVRLALAGSGKTLCADLRPASLDIETQACSDLAAQFARRKPRR